MVKVFASGFLLFVLCLSGCVGLSADGEFKKGVKYAEAGDKKKAFSHFKKAAKIAPDSARYHFAAAQVSPDQNTQFMYTKFAWEKGFKNRGVFSLLLQMSVFTDKKSKLEYALNLFKELPESLATDVFKGELYFQFEQPDSAYALWHSEFIRTEKSELCPKIANALARMGKSDEGIDFLFRCKGDGLLDADGFAYLASLLALKYDFKAVDQLFAEVSRSNHYNDLLRLEYATFLTFNDRFDEAVGLLGKPTGPGSPAAKELIGLRFTMLDLYISLMRQQKDRVALLLKVDANDTLLAKQKNELFTAVKAYLDKDTSSFSLLQQVLPKFPPDPVVMLFFADAAARKKMFREAVAIYGNLPGIVLWSPRVVVSRAQLFSLSGEDDEALKVISYMHKQRIFTRPSLELFRNLTLKKDLLDKSNAAQQLLEQQYSNDVGLRWKGLLLAIKNEKYDSALTIAKTLAELYPKEERFVLTQLSILLMKKEFRQVLERTSSLLISPSKIKPIEAAAYQGLGDTAKAIEAYETVIKERRDPLLVMQLAEMYYQKKMFDKATGLYTKLIEDNADSLSKDSSQLAIALNNNAWTIMAAGAQDLSGALSMAKRALEIAPDNLHIVDTYASILYEAKKYKECALLIENNPKALTQKRLLCHLARTFEKLKNSNKAKRYFEDALAVKKELQELPPILSDEQIKNEIKRLTEE